MKNRYKIFGILFLLLFIVMDVTTFFINRTSIQIGESEKFNENELENAISCLYKENIKFKKIWYDEEQSNLKIEDYLAHETDTAATIKPENIIVIFSEFNVPDSSATTNKKYKNYPWILARSSRSDNWEVIDHGL